jgi:hypothetical protein
MTFPKDVQHASKLLIHQFPQLTLTDSNMVALDTIRSLEGRTGFQKFVSHVLVHFQKNQSAYFNQGTPCNKTMRYQGTSYKYKIKLQY